MKYVVKVKHESGVEDKYTYTDAKTAEQVFHFFATQDGFTATILVEN